MGRGCRVRVLRSSSSHVANLPTDSDLLRDTPVARSLLSAGVPAAEVLAGLKQQTAEAAPTLLRRRSSNLGEAPLPAGWEERFDPANGRQVLRRFQHPEPRPIFPSFLFYPPAPLAFVDATCPDRPRSICSRAVSQRVMSQPIDTPIGVPIVQGVAVSRREADAVHSLPNHCLTLTASDSRI